MADTQNMPRLLLGNSVDAKCAIQEGLAAKLAKVHQKLLPLTPTSRAGLKVLQKMYTVCLETDYSVLIVDQINDPKAFLLAVSRPDDLAQCILKNLRPTDFIKLAWFNLLLPGHLLAQKKIKKELGKTASPSIYIMTLGRDQQALCRGTDLVAALDQIKQAIPFDKIWVDTEARNDRALSFYLKNSFKPVLQSFGSVLLSK